MWALTAATYIGACKFMRLLLAVKRRFSTTIPLHGRWHAPHEYYILCMCVCVCRTQWQPHTKPIWRVHKIRAVLCLCKPLTISCDVHTHDTYRPKSRAPGLMPVIKARACMKTHIIVLSPTSAHTHTNTLFARPFYNMLVKMAGPFHCTAATLQCVCWAGCTDWTHCGSFEHI